MLLFCPCVQTTSYHKHLNAVPVLPCSPPLFLLKLGSPILFICITKWICKKAYSWESEPPLENCCHPSPMQKRRKNVSRELIASIQRSCTGSIVSLMTLTKTWKVAAVWKMPMNWWSYDEEYELKPWTAEKNHWCKLKQHQFHKWRHKTKKE